MQWPDPIPLGKVNRFVDQDLPPSPEDETRKNNHLTKANLQLAQDKLKDKFHSEVVFVDIFASAKFAHSCVNVCPCITRSRGQSDPYTNLFACSARVQW